MTSTARLHSGPAGLPDEVDVLVVGLGVNGAGVALDAATRGLRVLAVDGHDLAFGTSRWSSKLIHGGLRYLAHGQFDVAYESAVERHLLATRLAPHLVRPIRMVTPITADWKSAALTGIGLHGGDLLRRVARTPGSVLPRPRILSAGQTLALAPGLRGAGLRGGHLAWDCQMEDDARMVLTIARTAAAHGARIHTRLRATGVDAQGVRLRATDGTEHTVRARAVVNAAGVWAGGVAEALRGGRNAPPLTLRPSRGTHLVFDPRRGRGSGLGGLRAAVTVPIPGSISRFVLVLPQPDGTVYVGLTDEPVTGPIPDVPTPSEAEIGFLLDVVGGSFAEPLRRTDVVSAYAGLRPLLEAGGTGTDSSDGADGAGQGSTADISRKHAVLRVDAADGLPEVVTLVGGKFTTYRRMAADAMDAVASVAADAGPSLTATTPLLGADPLPPLPAGDSGWDRLIRRYGSEAAVVLERAGEASGRSSDDLLARVGPECPVTFAELVFGVVDEGARSVEDLLERRTRVAFLPEEYAVAETAAQDALALL